MIPVLSLTGSAVNRVHRLWSSGASARRTAGRARQREGRELTLVSAENCPPKAGELTFVRVEN